MEKKTKQYFCDKCGREVFEAKRYKGIMARIRQAFNGAYSPGLVGVVVNASMGYSFGGWGVREDKPLISAEVCIECFNEIEGKYNDLLEALIKDSKK
ncbi:MAG: hypothetical protein RLY61_748 [Candidatus Parcubacteria bacterium]|jgi:DNA-directed RNA polymerase subunit RPC12/RpoP